MKSYLRYRMSHDLNEIAEVPILSPPFSWVPWHENWIVPLSDIMMKSFADTIDAKIFPNFITRSGCQKIITYLLERKQIIQQSTWLIFHRQEGCAFIQSVLENQTGMIQNLGVTPNFRRNGLAKAMLLRSLWVFRIMNLARAELEVSAENSAALDLYERLGFQITGTTFRTPVKDDSLLCQN